MQAVGTEKVLEIMNEIFRLSGAAYDLNVDDRHTRRYVFGELLSLLSS